MTEASASGIATLNVLNLIAYIANVGLINGVPTLLKLPDNAEVSEKYQTIVTPAGWAFAIWGLIFLMQAVWAVLQVAVPSFRHDPQVVHGVGYNYLLVCACQIAWTVAFALEQITMSMLWMVGICFYLWRIHSAQDRVENDSSDDTSLKNYWILQFPFGLHFGWIIAATLLNANLWLVAFGVSSDIKYGAGIATVAAAVAVSVGVFYKETKKSHTTLVIPLVLAWALNAISKELNHPREKITNEFSESQIDAISVGSFLSAMFLLVSSLAVMLYGWVKNRRPGSSEAEESLLGSEE